jgi:hypothetical protein
MDFASLPKISPQKFAGFFFKKTSTKLFEVEEAKLQLELDAK